MKQFLKRISKKTALIAVMSVLVGSGATVGVFAAIPNSTNGIITACRTNLTGTLRIIDAQSGAACNGLETTMTWSSATTDQDSALLRLDPDSSHAYTYVMNTAHSRNILDVKTVDDPNPSNTTTKYLCIEVAFNPEMRFAGAATETIGGGSTIDVKLASQSSTYASGIPTLCGTGYNALIFLSTDTTVSGSQNIFFTN